MKKMKLEREKKVFLGSTIFGTALILVGVMVGDMAVVANFLVIAIFAVIIPLFLIRYSEFVWLGAVEKEFPNFIRALADSTRSGMSFEEAVKIASKSNFGRLTDEVKKMKNRMEWGTSFIRTLEILGERVKKSSIITESLEIIKESFKSGGDVTATLDSIASNMSMLKEIEEERKSLTHQQVLIMYGIFIMFMSISVITAYVMIPMAQTQQDVNVGGLQFGFSDPCKNIYDTTFPCSFFGGVGLLFDLQPGISLYYTALFFSVVLILAIFIGLIAGQLGENSVIAGSKHSIIMASVTLCVFIFLSKAGLLPT